MATTVTEPLVLELPDRLGGPMEVRHIASDFTGTVSVDGDLVYGMDEVFNELVAKGVKIHFLTADTHGKAKETLARSPVSVEIVQFGEDKVSVVKSLGLDETVVIGNGHNDVAMFRVARFGIAVMEGEGLASDLLGLCIGRGWPVVRSGRNAYDLLAKPARLKATLRD